MIPRWIGFWSGNWVDNDYNNGTYGNTTGKNNNINDNGIYSNTTLDWFLKWYWVNNSNSNNGNENDDDTFHDPTQVEDAHLTARPSTLEYSNPDPLKLAHSPQAMLLCPNPDPLKRTHLPQGMLLLNDPTRYCVMNRKYGECYMQAITRNPDPEVNCTI